LRAGLDVVRSNVMLADDTYNIMYLNSSLKSMMKDAEAEIRRAMPHSIRQLVGANMDVSTRTPHISAS